MDGSASEDSATDFARLWQVLAKVVAPTTLVTALMVYFGWARASVTYRVFGLDQSVLGLSLQDYLFRSIDATIEPLAGLLLAVMIAIPVHLLLTGLFSRLRAAARWAVAAVAAAGAGACLAGLAGITGLGRYRSEWPIVPMSLGLGVMLIGYAVHLHSLTSGRRLWPGGESPPLRTARRVAFMGLLILTALWSAAVYAQNRGVDVARDLVVDARRLPGVVVYAPERLPIEGPGVQESALPVPPGDRPRHRYRYDGLRLLIHAGRQYFLLPVCWRGDGRSRVIGLPDDKTLRLEFFRVTGPPRPAPPAQCRRRPGSRGSRRRTVRRARRTFHRTPVPTDRRSAAAGRRVRPKVSSGGTVRSYVVRDPDHMRRRSPRGHPTT
ncbi:hypothetical protein [Planobispora takensis]|uniref:hypothetical protein n=1 Tax=Planobispora takensis TaxID=1367882 RepID=UPI00194042BD|nr:hypothetical protein [Planobispora takensis]